MAQKSHSQVSHNRRFATAVFGERQTVRQKVLLPLWIIFDQVQRGLPIGPFRLAPRADIPPAPVL